MEIKLLKNWSIIIHSGKEINLTKFGQYTLEINLTNIWSIIVHSGDKPYKLQSIIVHSGDKPYKHLVNNSTLWR